jgi:hypothetical protein
VDDGEAELRVKLGLKRHAVEPVLQDGQNASSCRCSDGERAATRRLDPLDRIPLGIPDQCHA